MTTLVKTDRVRRIDDFIDYFGERRHDAATEPPLLPPTATAGRVMQLEPDGQCDVRRRHHS
jgi:hypothetical protein